MILQDTDGNNLQMITPYKYGLSVDSFFTSMAIQKMVPQLP